MSTTPPGGLGRIAHWDPRNENFLIDAVLPEARALMAVRSGPLPPSGALAAALTPKTRRWRQWYRWDQGTAPTCTAHGTLTTMSAAPVLQPDRGRFLVDPLTFYREIQAVDRAEGRFHAEGATGLAAMKAARARGWLTEFRWTLDPEVALLALSNHHPLMVGTNWYWSMWDRDAEGIARITKTSPIAGGHWWTINGYDAKRGLLRHPSTWGDGDYWIPVEDFARLLAEDAECALALEQRVVL